MEINRIKLVGWTVGEQICGDACLVQKDQRTTKDGKPYLVVRLRHRNGEAELRVWSEDVPRFDGVQLGDGVRVTARVKEGWRGGLELTVLGVEPLETSHPIRCEMNPVCPVSYSALEARFEALRALLSARGKTLLQIGLDAYGGARLFGVAPAAAYNHHAYLHGLLEHSVEVAEIALDLSRRSRLPATDRDLLIVGALLHDAAKVLEYEWQGVPIRISEVGRLCYHTALGVAELRVAFFQQSERLRKAGIREADQRHLLHIILSHHGKQEWGSPTEPVTVEAHLVHLADEASARLRGIGDALDRGPEDTPGWVRHRVGGRNGWLWRPPAPADGQDDSMDVSGHCSGVAPEIKAEVERSTGTRGTGEDSTALASVIDGSPDGQVSGETCGQDTGVEHRSDDDPPNSDINNGEGEWWTWNGYTLEELRLMGFRIT